jgi:hypothetical protein
MEIYKSLFEDQICRSMLNSTEGDYTSTILENTYNIDKDADYIYNKFFKDFIIKFKKKSISKEDLGELSKIISIESSELRGEDCIKAHKINPITIYRNILDKGQSRYNTEENYISLKINMDAFNLVINSGFDYKELKNKISPNKYKSLIEETTESRVTSTIHHELSHWLNDSLHGRNLKKLSDLATQLDDEDILKLKQKDVNLTHFEIDAQTHAIKNLKNQKKKIWDTMPIDDVFYGYTQLRWIAKDVLKKYGKDVLEIWEKNLLKRMHREGLLGKNMKGFISLDILTEKWEKGWF